MRNRSFRKWCLSILLMLFLCLTQNVQTSHAQSSCETWNQIASPQLAELTERPLGFTIGNKGYVIRFGTTNTADVQSYDPSSDTWTGLNNFPGSNRYGGIAFTLNGKGYMGLGQKDGVFYNDIWEYDPTNDSWVQKSNFGGIAREGAVVFTINSDVYVGTGKDGAGNYLQDFWKYNISTDSWSSIASLPGDARFDAVAFSLGDKGYVGTGVNAINTYLKDMWMYDPLINNWSQKADFAGVPRIGATAITIGNRSYVGLGQDSQFFTYVRDFWKYNATNDVWTQVSNIPDDIINPDFQGRAYAVGLVINSKGYIGGGFTALFPVPWRFDYYEFTPCPPCSGDIIIYDNNVTIPFETKAGDYIAFGDIDGNTTGQVLTITTSSQTVTLQAANYVDFVEGADISVDANTNNYLDVVIEDCDLITSRITNQSINIASQTSLQESLQVNLFPNPTQGRVNVEVRADETSSIRVTVINLKGEVVKVLEDTGAQSQTFPVDLSNQPKGIYLVKVTTDKGSVVKRVVVN